jgi:hypothetical protein
MLRNRREPGYPGRSRSLPGRRLGQISPTGGWVQQPGQTAGGWTAPPGHQIMHQPNAASTLSVLVRAYRADTVSPLVVAAKAEIFTWVQGLPGSDFRTVAQGATGPDGTFTFNLDVPAPAQGFGFRITVSPAAGGVSFPPKSKITNGWLPNNLKATALVFAVCPSGTDDLICEVGEMQLSFVEVQEKARLARGVTAPDNLVIEAAHQYVPQPRNPILQKYWDQLSWGVIDLGIPPSDWPDILKRYDQAMTLLNEIPLPPMEPTRRLFRNCMRALPIYDGLSLMNIRLYSKTFSRYFPREDYKIRAEMAASYLLNIHMIFECMIRRLEAKARDVKRHLRNLAMIRMAAALVFAPLAGGAMLTILATEPAQALATNYGLEHGGDLKGVVAGAAKNASAGGAAIGIGLFAAGAAYMIDEITKDANPIVQTLSRAIGPKLAEAAAKDILAGVVQEGTASGAGLLSAAGLGTAGATLAVEYLLSMITATGARNARKFVKDAVQVQEFIVECALPEEGKICEELAPFVLWSIEAMMLGAFFDRVMEEADLEESDTLAAGTPEGAATGVTQTEVIEPSAALLEERGVPVPPNATRPGGATISPGTNLVAAAGIGGGALLALLLVGAFGR